MAGPSRLQLPTGEAAGNPRHEKAPPASSAGGPQDADEAVGELAQRGLCSEARVRSSPQYGGRSSKPDRGNGLIREIAAVLPNAGG